MVIKLNNGQYYFANLLNLLRNQMTDKITFASGDWTLDFALEEGVVGKSQHITRTLNRNADKVEGTYIKFETNDEDLVEGSKMGL